MNPARIVDQGPGIPGDLPSETVGIREVGAHTTPWRCRRFTKNATTCPSCTLEELLELRSRPHVLREREEHATMFGVRAGTGTGVLRKCVSWEEREELPPHLEERDMVIAARVFLEPHRRVETTADREVTHPEGDEGDVRTQTSRGVGAHGRTMTWNHPQGKRCRVVGLIDERAADTEIGSDDLIGPMDASVRPHCSIWAARPITSRITPAMMMTRPGFMFQRCNTNRRQARNTPEKNADGAPKGQMSGQTRTTPLKAALSVVHVCLAMKPLEENPASAWSHFA